MNDEKLLSSGPAVDGAVASEEAPCAMPVAWVTGPLRWDSNGPIRVMLAMIPAVFNVQAKAEREQTE